jgi:hypothetical protein
LPTKQNQAHTRNKNYYAQRGWAKYERNYPFYKEILA